jgi:GDPmannose 4,6-dehydratase
MKKALILGISGQDGAYLSKFLLANNYKVYGTSRDAQLNSFHNLQLLNIKDQIKLYSLAINDFRSVFSVLNDIKPDEIYNLAGQSSVGLSFQQPVETMESITMGTLNILETLRLFDRQIKFYNACSSECFGNITEGAADESTSFRPRSPYAVAKAAAFWEVDNYRQSYNIFACSGILFNHESPLRAERFVTQKIIAACCRIYSGSREKLHLGNIDIQRDWGWAPEYVEAMWQIMQQNRPDDYIIATGVTHKLKDFLNMAFSSLGLKWQQHVVIDKNLYRPEELTISRANPGKANNRLGWKAKFTCMDITRMMIDARLSTNE